MIGHILAFVCIMIWGSTFVSSKILLDSFTPIELLFIRFLIGFLTLCILSPKSHLIKWDIDIINVK